MDMDYGKRAETYPNGSIDAFKSIEHSKNHQLQSLVQILAIYFNYAATEWNDFPKPEHVCV